MSSQSAELDSAATAGRIQAGGHYATPPPHTPPAQEEVDHSQSQVGVWLTAGGVGGDPRGSGESECRDDCGIAGQAVGTVRDS